MMAIDQGTVSQAVAELLVTSLPLALVLATFGYALTALPALGIWSRLEAEKKATALLLELLSDEQRGQAASLECVTVRSTNVGNRVYLIPTKHGMVQMYEAGKLRAALCLEPIEWLPRSDVVLMHKLMIEGDEEEYLRLASSMPAQYIYGPYNLPEQLSTAIGR